MPEYEVRIVVTTKPEVGVDPIAADLEGKLKGLGYDIEGVKTGKIVDLVVSAARRRQVFSLANKASRDLLANRVLEDYAIQSIRRRPKTLQP